MITDRDIVVRGLAEDRDPSTASRRRTTAAASPNINSTRAAQLRRRRVPTSPPKV